MSKITGADSLVKTLKDHGIRYVFGNPGSSFASILDAIIGSTDIQFILGVQEASVIGMADGYTRATGTPGVVMVHTTPGLCNSLGGFYNAYASGVPLVLIAGNQDSKVLGRTTFCESPDITLIPRQYAKLSQEITRADRIPEILARALRASMARPMGPCFLSLARDLQALEFEGKDSEIRREPLALSFFRPDAERVRSAAELLAEAENPVVLAGFDIAKDQAHPEVVALSELLGAPVFGEEITNTSGLSFPMDHPQYLGYFEPGLEFVEKADVILAIGKKLFAEFAYSSTPRLPRTAKLIHLHENPWEIGKLHIPWIDLHGDTKSGTRDLLEALRSLAGAKGEGAWEPRREERLKEIGAAQEKRRRRLEENAAKSWNATPIQLPRLAKEIAALMTPEVTVVNEATRSTAALFNYVDFHRPDSLYSCPGGYLGWGLPAALGIKLARPERKVLAYLGDGTTLYTLQALWSATKYRLPVVAVICNNGAYLAVKAHLQTLAGNAARGASFEGAELTPRVNFARVAEGFGARGYTVTDPSQLGPTLREALASNETCVVDVLLDSTIPPATR